VTFAVAIDIYRDHRDKRTLDLYNRWIFLVMNVVQALIKLLIVLPTIGECLGGSAEIMKIILKKPVSPEIPLEKQLKVVKGMITFDNVKFTYPGSPTPAITNFKLSIEPNTKVAIVGDSGAGKSTLFQLITRFYDVDADGGRLCIDNQDLSTVDARSIREIMAMVRQDSDLFSATYLENILYGVLDPLDGHVQKEIESILGGLREKGKLSRKEREIVEHVMDAVRAANCDFVRTSKDLANTLGEGGRGLSGGQKQRLTIARALYKNPRILLLDEVTSALDQISESIILTALDRLTRDRTVLIVAHRLHTIKNSDVIIVMERGNIAAMGKHTELMETSPKYRKMVEAAEEKSAEIKNSKTAKVLDLMKDIAADVKTSKTTTARQIKKLLRTIVPQD